MTFYLDLSGHGPTEQKAQLSSDDPDVEGEPTAKRPRLGKASAPSSDKQELHILGEPLAAHQFVLHACSERFAAELQRWQGGAPGDAQATLGNGLNVAAGLVAASRPVLRVPLGAETELPAALAALRFAYTGAVEAGSVTEALEVRRQAAYLRIEGCCAACMERIRELLGPAAATEAEQPQQQQTPPPPQRQQQPQQPEHPQQQQEGQGAAGNAGPQGAGSVAGGSGGRAGPRTAAALGPVPPPLLEFFRASALWPEEAEEPAFSGVLEFAKQRLVAHFGDTLRILNSPFPSKELTSLPAVALEALLESDDFGTDDEASVLLMLATWMEANYATIGAETRKRLCGKVRLVQMNRPYVTAVLPALAADHMASQLRPAQEQPARRGQPVTRKEQEEEEDGEEELVLPGGWFPITVAEAAFIASLASAALPGEWDALLEGAANVYDLQSPWYSTQPRRQCLPEGGLVYRWSVPQSLLKKTLLEAEKHELQSAWLNEDYSMGSWFGHGFIWEPEVLVDSEGPGGELHLSCHLPGVLRTDGSVAGSTQQIVTTAPPARAILTVHYREHGVLRSERLLVDGAAQVVRTGGSWTKDFEHVHQPPAGANGMRRLLDPWVAYLRGGRVTGTFRLLPPVREQGEQGAPQQQLGAQGE